MWGPTDYPAAEGYYTKGVDIQPNSQSCCYDLGQCCGAVRIGRKDAIALYQKPACNRPQQRRKVHSGSPYLRAGGQEVDAAGGQRFTSRASSKRNPAIRAPIGLCFFEAANSIGGTEFNLAWVIGVRTE